MKVLWQMKILSGQVLIHGRIAYVSQQPWVFNATIRENILLGNIYDEERSVSFKIMIIRLNRSLCA